MTETYEEPINGGDIIKSWYFEDTLYPIMNNYNYYYYNERQNSGKGIERQLNKRYKTGIKYINR